MSVSALPSSPTLIPLAPPSRGGGATSLKLGLRSAGAHRPSTPRLDEYAGLEQLDREELDEDFVPPSRQRVA
jgi:hypothetical protein